MLPVGDEDGISSQKHVTPNSAPGALDLGAAGRTARARPGREGGRAGIVPGTRT